MCDREHFSELRDRVDQLEHDQLVIDTKQDEQIKTLFESVKTMRNVMYTFALIMLLAIIYGALGPRGFNAVTHAAPNVLSNNNHNNK